MKKNYVRYQQITKIRIMKQFFCSIKEVTKLVGCNMIVLSPLLIKKLKRQTIRCSYSKVIFDDLKTPNKGNSKSLLIARMGKSSKSGKWLQHKRCSLMPDLSSPLTVFPLSAEIPKAFFFLISNAIFSLNGWHCSHQTEIFKENQDTRMMECCLQV